MGLPIPFRVQAQGASDDGPRGAIPIALYGASGGGTGGPIAITDVTGLTTALDDKVETSEFSSYQATSLAAFENLEEQVSTNTSNLSNTTETANTAVQPTDLRLPILLTQTQYDGITPIPGQVYIIQGA